jgi:hypothetical protein
MPNVKVIREAGSKSLSFSQWMKVLRCDFCDCCRGERAKTKLAAQVSVKRQHDANRVIFEATGGKGGSNADEFPLGHAIQCHRLSASVLVQAERKD